ncbi:DUF4330 domain-containing protein [Ructibacterium gallinarum]|uniref:DUF4330 domain-containing protein n=1 Tax=Ructibacterium gallinarum TaxID=2779355 RepID=A0A9D5LWT3_9FIRM|nr:DUF4330 domain-containing protein [Ructibacterium gallinarum]MBE5039198.1 DUF4330 domain-containing protein [Ructibacterium gallinarum]
MKPKFNAIDFVILILLIAALAAGSLFLSKRSNQKGVTQNAKIEFMVELTSQEKEFADLPQVGDSVSVGEKEKMPATVTKVEVLPAKTMGYDTVNGRIFETTVPDRYDVQITLQGDGMETENTLEINNNAIRVGMGAAMKSKNWAGFGFVLTADVVQ